MIDINIKKGTMICAAPKANNPLSADCKAVLAHSPFAEFSHKGNEFSMKENTFMTCSSPSRSHVKLHTTTKLANNYK